MLICDGVDGAQGEPGLDAPQIDDAAVGADHLWSSSKVLDALCPPFEVKGNAATCYPAASSPLSVTAHIAPVQADSGDPSPDNIRPIAVQESVIVTHNDTECCVVLPDGFAGGDVDLTGGEVAEEWSKVIIDGSKVNAVYTLFSGSDTKSIRVVSSTMIDGKTYTTSKNCETLFATHYCVSGWTRNQPTIFGADGYITINDNRFVDGPTAKAILSADPVTIYYKLTTPKEPISIAAQPIDALPGCNTLTTDAQSIMVSGHADPIKTINDLAARIEALENIQ